MGAEILARSELSFRVETAGGWFGIRCVVRTGEVARERVLISSFAGSDHVNSVGGDEADMACPLGVRRGEGIHKRGECGGRCVMGWYC